MKAWSAIKLSGLNRMERNHIHMAIGDFDDSQVQSGIVHNIFKAIPDESGVRQTASVLIYVDVDKIIADGIPLFLSENKVVLSPGKGTTGVIPPEYFLAVVDSTTKQPFDTAYPNPAPSHV